MEYVDGETLRHRLSNSRLSIRESLEIAIQVAAALSAAHAASIIHRDIKPENVMLRPDGFVEGAGLWVGEAGARSALNLLAPIRRRRSGRLTQTLSLAPPPICRRSRRAGRR